MVVDTNLTSSVVTDMTNLVDTYTVDDVNTDGVQDQKETAYLNTNWTQQLGYFKKIPELNRAITTLSVWTAGKGYTADLATELLLERITGWGEETFNQIMTVGVQRNILVLKKDKTVQPKFTVALINK